MSYIIVSSFMNKADRTNDRVSCYSVWVLRLSQWLTWPWSDL